MVCRAWIRHNFLSFDRDVLLHRARGDTPSAETIARGQVTHDGEVRSCSFDMLTIVKMVFVICQVLVFVGSDVHHFSVSNPGLDSFSSPQ